MQKFQWTEGTPLNISLCKSRATISKYSNAKIYNRLLFKLKSQTWREKEKTIFQNKKQSKLKLFKFKRQLSTHSRTMDHLDIQFCMCWHMLWTPFKIVLTSGTFLGPNILNIPLNPLAKSKSIKGRYHRGTAFFKTPQPENNAEGRAASLRCEQRKESE